jgi:hypothetical protein
MLFMNRPTSLIFDKNSIAHGYLFYQKHSKNPRKQQKRNAAVLGDSLVKIIE